MGLAHSCKSEGLVQKYRIQKYDWKTRLKNQNAIQVRVRVQVQIRKRSNTVNSIGKLGASDTKNVLKQQSNDTQGTATHSRLLSKKPC